MKKKRRKRLAERVVEKGWVVGDRGDNAHNLVVGHCEYIVEVAGLIGVATGLKTVVQPACNFR